MISSLRRAALFACYQSTVAVGIALLPVAIAAKQVGVPLPIHRVVRRLGDAYDRSAR